MALQVYAMLFVVAMITPVLRTQPASVHSSQSSDAASLALKYVTEPPSSKTDMFSIPPECGMQQENEIDVFDAITSANTSDACLEAVGRRLGISASQVRLNLKLAIDPAVDELANEIGPTDQILTWNEQPEPSVQAQNRTSNKYSNECNQKTGHNQTGTRSRDRLITLVYRTRSRQIMECLIRKNSFPRVYGKIVNDSFCNKHINVSAKDNTLSFLKGIKRLCANIYMECLKCSINCFGSEPKLCHKLCQLQQPINPPEYNLENCIRSGHCISTPNDDLNGYTVVIIAIIILAILIGVLTIVLILRVYSKTHLKSYMNTEECDKQLIVKSTAGVVSINQPIKSQVSRGNGENW